MQFNKKNRFSFTILLLLFVSTPLLAKTLTVVTTTAELADITEQIGKNHTKVIPLVIKNWDIHHVEPRPSMVIQVKKADLVIRNGMSLDIWFDSILSVAKNSKVFSGEKGYVDASLNIKKLEVPTGPTNQSMGDVHKQGNPHYMLDPRNVLIVAKTIRDGLIENDPSNRKDYQDNYNDFVSRYQKNLDQWAIKIQKLKQKKAITYHKTWVYFFNYSQMQLAGTLEPVPGIPPTPVHIANLSKSMANKGVDIILLSPYYSDKEAKILASSTGTPIISLPTSVEIGSKQYGSYTQMMDTVITKLVEATQ